MEDVLGLVLEDQLLNSEGDTLASVEYWAQLRGEQIQMQVFMEEPDSLDYRFRLMLSGEGRVDIWTTNIFGTSDIVQEGALPNALEFPDIENYVLPDKRMHMVSSWTCSDKVITVANYVNRSSYVDVNGETTTINETEGALATSSSSGPTRDDRQKPDLAATGTVTLSTGNFQMLEGLIENEPFKVAQGGMHFRNAGSSMASPVVAGTAALVLEQCPFADQATVKSAILENTATDSFTGLDLPGERWASAG
jgi:subtilisin family serine protease